jgi:Mg-chelatase subunit ChlI
VHSRSGSGWYRPCTLEVMALPDRDLPPTPEWFTSEERARQEALNRSWLSARRAVEDSTVRARLEAAIAEVDARSEPETVTVAELRAIVAAGR